MPGTDQEIALEVAVEEGRALVSGTFKIAVDPKYDHHEAGPRALVMVASSPGSFVACRPFRSRVPMADDVAVVGEVASGRFSLELAEFMPAPLSGRYHVLMSLGMCVSEVATFDV